MIPALKSRSGSGHSAWSPTTSSRSTTVRASCTSLPRSARSTARSANAKACRRSTRSTTPRASRRSSAPRTRARPSRTPTPTSSTRSAPSGKLVRAVDYTHSYPHCWRCDTPLIYWAKPTWFARTSAIKRRAAPRERDDQLAPRAHQVRALRRLAGQQRRLGALPRPLLGHADPGVALRRLRPRHVHRLGRRAVGAVRPRPRRHGPAPPVRRRRDDLGARRATRAPRPASRRCSTRGSTRARCRPRSSTTRSRTARPSARASPPTSSARRSTRRAAGSTPCSRSTRSCSTARRTATSYASRTSSTVTAPRCRSRAATSSIRGRCCAPAAPRRCAGTCSSSGSPWTPKRVYEEGIDEATRQFLLTLWNVYSFFVTYANLDEWSPGTGNGAPASEHVLDRWIRSRSAPDGAYGHRGARVVRFAHGCAGAGRAGRRPLQLVRAPVPAALLEVVGSGRARHAARVPHDDHPAARAVLPVRDRRDVPQPRARRRIGARDRLARRRRVRDRRRRSRPRWRSRAQLVSLGRAARADAKIGVRQPLPRAIALAGRRGRCAPTSCTRSPTSSTSSSFEVVTTLEGLLSYHVVPNFRALGPRLGKLLPRVKELLAKIDGAGGAARVRHRRSLRARRRRPDASSSNRPTSRSAPSSTKSSRSNRTVAMQSRSTSRSTTTCAPKARRAS